MEPIDMPTRRRIQDNQRKKLKRIRAKKDAAAAAEVVQADLDSRMEQVVDDSLWKAKVDYRKSLQQRMSHLPPSHINQVRFCIYVPRW
jgi:vacuolar-type H+-ATPase subunit E/Vma4